MDPPSQRVRTIKAEPRSVIRVSPRATACATRSAAPQTLTRAHSVQDLSSGHRTPVIIVDPLGHRGDASLVVVEQVRGPHRRGDRPLTGRQPADAEDNYPAARDDPPRGLAGSG